MSQRREVELEQRMREILLQHCPELKLVGDILVYEDWEGDTNATLEYEVAELTVMKRRER